MEHVSTTPFGQRPVSAGLLASQMLAQAPCPVARADKWAVFHDLRMARAAFGVTDRDLVVLNALLSFLPDRDLCDGAPLIVHPSNAVLTDRAHGMAESTLRRHLAALVAAGLIARHDSPNGKRYVTRGYDGDPVRAFGFDLRPLLVQSARIAALADDARRAEREAKLARELAVLRLRDASKLLDYLAENGLIAGATDALAALAGHRLALRRKLGVDELRAVTDALTEMAERFAVVADQGSDETEEADGNAGQNGRHQHNSNSHYPESDPCLETGEGSGVAPKLEPGTLPDRPAPRLPLVLILKACPDVLPYARDPIRDWRDLVATMSTVCGMMGISRDAWDDAQRVMGPAEAAICTAAILQRINDIRRPGGYLRALTEKARAGSFSTGPMIMALLSTANRAPV